MARNHSQARYPSLWHGLIGCWRPEEGGGRTLRDFSAYGDEGTLTNFASQTIYVPAPRGVAISYDGTNDYVNLNNPPRVDIVGPLSFGMWIRQTNFANYRNIFWKAMTSYSQYGIIVTAAGTWSAQNNSPTDVAGATLTLNKWHHLAITYDGTTMATWQDGKFLSSGARSLATINANFTLGGDTANSRYFAGQIGEFCMWNRPLAGHEVAVMASGASPLEPSRRMLGKAAAAILTRHRVGLIG